MPPCVGKWTTTVFSARPATCVLRIRDASFWYIRERTLKNLSQTGLSFQLKVMSETKMIWKDKCSLERKDYFVGIAILYGCRTEMLKQGVSHLRCRLVLLVL
jgi:hypothetical protein